MASDDYSSAKVILFIVLEFPVKSMWESGQPWSVHGEKKYFQAKKLFPLP